MSRRSQRLRGNLESLSKAGVHQCQLRGCYNRGQGCYSSPEAPKPSGWYCVEHRAEHGYCTNCGLAASNERFEQGPGKGFCDHCWFDLFDDPPDTQDPVDENYGLPPFPPAETRFDALEL
jgi:hypothetical protein